LLGGIDGKEEAGSQGVAPVLRGAEAEVRDHSAGRGKGRKVVRTVEGLAGNLLPVIEKSFLKLAHDWSANLVLSIAPLVLVLGIADPEIGVSRTPGVGEVTVDDHRLAVSAIVVAAQFE